MTARIDTELRHRLSQDVRRLVTGRMSNDDFDDIFYDCYCESDDLAIREISRFGWGLYSSDVLFPYRLRGRHAVNETNRQRAAYAVLFLQTQNEYDYPETPDSCGYSIIGGLWYIGLPLSIVILVIGLAGWLAGGEGLLAADFMLIGTIVLAGSLLLALAQRNSDTSWRDKLENVGDMALWPFIDDKSFVKANGNHYLLSNFQPKIIAPPSGASPP